jgi:hypothetical protein
MGLDNDDDDNDTSSPCPPSPKRQRQQQQTTTEDAIVEVKTEEGSATGDNEFSLKFHFPNIPNSARDFPVCSSQTHEQLRFKINYLENQHLQGKPIKSVVVTFDRDDWNVYTITVENRSGEISEYGNAGIDEVTKSE